MDHITCSRRAVRDRLHHPHRLAVGAGWEYGFTPNWSGRVEYRYTDFDTFRNNSTVSFPGFSYEHDPVFHTVRAGVSLSLRRPGGREVLICPTQSNQQLKAPASSGAFVVG